MKAAAERAAVKEGIPYTMAVISNKNMRELLDEDRKRSSGTAPEASVLETGGRLAFTGRYVSEPAPFDRERVPAAKRLFRLKETESFLIFSDPLFMRVSAGDMGYAGFASVTAVNRRTGAGRTRSRVFPFTFGSMEMPSSPSRGDMMLRKGDLSLDFSRSPSARYIRCRFEDFDDVRALYMNLESEYPAASPEPSGSGGTGAAGAYYSLRPGSAKRRGKAARPGGFEYSAYVPCMRSAGTVVIGADHFDFSGGGCFTSYEWFRGLPPRRTRRAALTVCGGTGDSILGISASQDGTLLYDGVHTSVCGPTEFEPDREDPSRPFKVSSPDGKLSLDFTPIAWERESLSFSGLARLGTAVIFGRADGLCRADGGGTLRFADIYAAVTLTDAKW